MGFEVTTALERIGSLTRRIRVVQGGTSAGKTIAILILLLNEAIENENLLISIVSDSFPNLRRGAMRDFLKICEWTNVDKFSNWNKSNYTMTLPNKSVIEFFSTDMLGALGARRDILFVNEANRITFDTFSQLESRTERYCFLDFNPVNEFWVHRELLTNDSGFREATDFLKLTYLDNEALSENIVRSIELRKGDGTSNWWRVYGLGEIGSLEGNIYEGWTATTEEKLKEDGYLLVRYGLDFGFSNDETAMASIYMDEEGHIGLVEKIYETGLLPSSYTPKFREVGIDPNVLIVADGARPEIIAEIKKEGYRIIPANKDGGSVRRGIDRVRERSIRYCGKDLEREFLTYAWRKRKSGEILDEPQDGNDHLMDAIRYAIDDLGRPKVVWGGIR